MKEKYSLEKHIVYVFVRFMWFMSGMYASYAIMVKSLGG